MRVHWRFPLVQLCGGAPLWPLTHPVAAGHGLVHRSIHGAEANFALCLLLDGRGCSRPLGLQAANDRQKLMVRNKKYKLKTAILLKEFTSHHYMHAVFPQQPSAVLKLTFYSVHTRGRRTPPATPHPPPAPSCQSCRRWARPRPAYCRRRRHRRSGRKRRITQHCSRRRLTFPIWSN